MKVGPDIYIKVKVYGGSVIPFHVIPQMVALADRIGINVEARCNGVTVIAKPGDDARDLAADWEHWVINSQGQTHPIATAEAGRARREQAAREAGS